MMVSPGFTTSIAPWIDPPLATRISAVKAAGTSIVFNYDSNAKYFMVSFDVG